MRYLRNPTTGQVRCTTPLEAKKLLRYGWQPVNRQAYLDYLQAAVQASILRHIPAAKAKLGRVH